MEYPNLKSAIRPVPHSKEIPVPDPPNDSVVYDSDDEFEVEEGLSADENFVTKAEENTPELLSQQDLNDLVRDLNLTKHQSEVLVSRLKEKKVLTSDARITKFRFRSDTLVEHFSYENSLCFCNNILGLFESLNINYDPNDWRLFIDASLYSTKAVLLHNGNMFPSIPLAYSIILKETYQNLEYILKKLNYNDHKWFICADLKVVAILSGLQLGYTKNMCFLCEWDTRAREQHYTRKDWPMRDIPKIGSHNVINLPLVPKHSIILPPLHIKLGLMKQFVKALNVNNPSFLYLKSKFTKLSDAKIKEGIFVGPQIRQLLTDEKFAGTLNPLELRAWKLSKLFAKVCLANTKILIISYL